MTDAELDIVIPVYNEGENIVSVLESLHRDVRTKFRVLICFDFETDNTLPACRAVATRIPISIEYVKNQGRGPHGAVLSGFRASQAPAVLMLPADDDYNSKQIDKMVANFRSGSDIVCACRFMPGGCMKGCPWLKAMLVRLAAFTMHFLAGVPTRDSTNGLRMFSRRVLDSIPIESTQGFTYSIELLVKAHRRRLKITDVPFQWFERTKGKSRFKVGAWLFAYLHWYFYAFRTLLGARQERP